MKHFSRINFFLVAWPAVALSLALGGCVSAPTTNIAFSPWAQASAASAAPDWHHLSFPGKTSTRFTYERKDGRHAVRARADRSASMLRSVVRIEPEALGRLRFSWRVPALIAGADLALREADDSPVRIVLAFDGDRSRFTPRDAMLSELARTLTGEEMPYATLMYVWCNRREAGTVISSTRTGRIRKLVVESGAQRLDQWLEYERDVQADFQSVFGEAPGALIGVAIMSDADNTQSATSAWYGPLRMVAGPTADLSADSPR